MGIPNKLNLTPNFIPQKRLIFTPNKLINNPEKKLINPKYAFKKLTKTY